MMTQSKAKIWNRCDCCGKFIAFQDFDNGAKRVMVTPDRAYSAEEYETVCNKCNTAYGVVASA